MTFRTPYKSNPRVSLSSFPQSKTKQQFKEESDVNNILKKYRDTGILPSPNASPQQYGDFSEIMDYQSALNAVQHANEAFQGLPSSIRARFGNNPAQLLSFLQDDANKEEAIKLGILEKPAPTPVQINQDVSANASAET